MLSPMTQQASPAVVTMKPSARSKMTNARFKGKVSSKSLFLDGDGRSPWSRRYRDLVALFADDAGGLSTLTELKLALIRRAAALIVECERLENALADGEQVDVDLLARMSSHLRRIAETIGLDRVKHDVTPTLSAILAAHAEEKKAAKKPTKRAEPPAKPPIAAAPEKRTSDAREPLGEAAPDEPGDESPAPCLEAAE